MAPIIAARKDTGELAAAVGGSGGALIVTSVLQVRQEGEGQVCICLARQCGVACGVALGKTWYTNQRSCQYIACFLSVNGSLSAAAVSVSQVLARVLLLGQDPAAALAAPRLHTQLLPNVLAYEDWAWGQLSYALEPAAVAGLRARGQVLWPEGGSLGVTQARDFAVSVSLVA